MEVPGLPPDVFGLTLLQTIHAAQVFFLQMFATTLQGNLRKLNVLSGFFVSKIGIRNPWLIQILLCFYFLNCPKEFAVVGIMDQ